MRICLRMECLWGSDLVGLITGHNASIHRRIGNGLESSGWWRGRWIPGWHHLWRAVEEVKQEAGSQNDMGTQDSNDEEQRELRVPQGGRQYGNQNSARKQGGGDNQEPLKQRDLEGKGGLKEVLFP